MDLHPLQTPCLVLDSERVKRNAARMSERVRRFRAQLRPHVKTHKCAEVARIQTEGDSGAITVSTLAEAEFFADRDFSDITYAVPIEPGKFERAIELSKDRGAVEFDRGCGYGRVFDLEGRDLALRVDSVSQEHGVLTAPDSAALDRLKAGSRVRILANHSCRSAASALKRARRRSDCRSMGDSAKPVVLIAR